MAAGQLKAAQLVWAHRDKTPYVFAGAVLVLVAPILGLVLLLSALLGEEPPDSGGADCEWVVPGDGPIGSPFGPRNSPCSGCSSNHQGVDLGGDRNDILAARRGTVKFAGSAAGSSLQIIAIEHDEGYVTRYLHMRPEDVLVKEGDQVAAGQLIGRNGATGNVTGPHLHFEVIDLGNPINPVPFLAEKGIDLGVDKAGTGVGCKSDGGGGGGGTDPTNVDKTNLTTRMIGLIDEVAPRFGKGWGCWRQDALPDHPSGRACDVTFGNPIGQYPDPGQLADGWAMCTYLQANAARLGVKYLIWQGQIWSVARDAEGWRTYHGGTGVTQGHFDHVHITVD